MQSARSIETPSGKNKETENFPVGSLLIRPDLRRHVHAFYAFARAADDISDNPLLSGEEKTARLDSFAKSLLDDGCEKTPCVAELRRSLKETGVPACHSLDLLTAFKRDAVKLRYNDWGELMDYCRYSAAPVGRHVLALHGIGESAWGANDALCSALQVINHIQDCADDYAELDRVYIPLDMLAARGGRPEDLSGEASSVGLRAALDDMLDKMAPMLETARGLPPAVPDWRLKAETAVICALAEKLGVLLRRRDPLRDKVKLGKAATFAAVVSGIARALSR